jgi:DDE domain
LDEVFVRINGELRYLWRAVDQHGVVLDTATPVTTELKVVVDPLWVDSSLRGAFLNA